MNERDDQGSARTAENAGTPPARKRLLRALAGEKLDRPPFWLMRQAGRYLPEYRATRAKAGSFLDLCYNPALATEVTLQPIRRFGMDGAILFSDILVIPHALGQNVTFEEGRGPVLQALEDGQDLAKLTSGGLHDHLAPVYETVSRLKSELPSETTLIGFAGAPWTVATYMLEGGSSREFSRAKRWIAEKEADFAALIDLLVETTSDYLIAQIRAGAEVIQIFDSWAGALDPEAMRKWSLQPCRAISDRIHAVFPAIPVILFPRAVGSGYMDFAYGRFAQGLSLDTTVDPAWARAHLQSPASGPGITVQGNLDPMILVAGGEAMADSIRHILTELGDGPFIFNLGHGIVPQTPPEHVAALAGQIRNWPRDRR